MTPPVLLLVFNRPDLARITFDRIRAARPARLFIHADGPRPDRPGEAERCREVRALLQTVDWPCAVQRLYRDTNLGCGPAVAGALNWFFDQGEAGIVLEDDCAPHPGFFAYAAHQLAKHRDDPRVFHIAGTGFVPPGRTATAPATYLLPFPFVWGWASWARAWRQFRLQLPPLEEMRRTLSRHLRRPADRRYWLDKLGQTREGRISSWAYPWVYTLWAQNALAVTPTFSLITNTGMINHPTHDLGEEPLPFAPLFPGVDWPAHAAEIPTEPAAALAALNDRLFDTWRNAPPPRWWRLVRDNALVRFAYYGLRRRAQLLLPRSRGVSPVARGD